MLNSIAECGDRIKPTCNEITLPTDSPTLPTVVTTEKMQNQSQPFPKYFISLYHFEIIPLKEPRWHPLVTHSKQCSCSHGSQCFLDTPGQERVFSNPPAELAMFSSAQLLDRCSIISWESLGISCVCACGGSGASLGIQYSVPGWWFPWTRNWCTQLQA